MLNSAANSWTLADVKRVIERCRGRLWPDFCKEKQKQNQKGKAPWTGLHQTDATWWFRRVMQGSWLYPNSASASFGGAFEGQLCHNTVRSLSQSEGSSRCSFCSLFLEDAPLRSFVASHIPRFFAHPKNKKEGAKMATLRGVDCHKSWREGKTSGDTTRKCSKG